MMIPLHVDTPTPIPLTVKEEFVDYDVPEYTGSYNVTPSGSVQTLETNGKLMTDDVTVDAVPSGNLKTPSGTYSENLLIGYLDIAYGVDTAGYLPVSSSSYPIRLMDVLPTENTKTVTPTTSEQVAVMQNKWTKGQIKVGAIPSQYIVPTGTKAITENTSSVDVKTYEFASINVPNSYVAADEGKVVSNGALVAQTSDTVTTNGLVDTTLINSLTVNVSGGGGSWTWKEDGKTHIWLDIQYAQNLTQRLGLKVNNANNTITIDWGDNSETETVNSTTEVTNTHTYAQLGKYEIVLTFTLGGRATTGTATLSGLTNMLCSENVVAIEFSSVGFWASTGLGNMPNLIRVNQGNNVLNANYQYNYCAKLEEITGKKNSTNTMPTQWGNQIPNLKKLEVFFTNISSAGMQKCISLQTITFPSTFNALGQNALQQCYGLKELHFQRETPPSMSNVNAFASTRSDMKIYVPYSADHSILTAYKEASNWSTFASQIFEEPES